MPKTNKKFTEKQRLQVIGQLIKKDLTNLKKRKAIEPNSIEVICTPRYNSVLNICINMRKRKIRLLLCDLTNI